MGHRYSPFTVITRGSSPQSVKQYLSLWLAGCHEDRKAPLWVCKATCQITLEASSLWHLFTRCETTGRNLLDGIINLEQGGEKGFCLSTLARLPYIYVWMCTVPVWIDRAGGQGVVSQAPLYQLVRRWGREMLQLPQLEQRRKTFLPGQRATAALPAIQSAWIGAVGREREQRNGRDTGMITETISDLFNFVLWEKSSLRYGLRKLQVSSWSPLDFWLPALWGPTSITSLLLSILLLLAAVSHRASQYHLVSWADGGDLLVAPVFVFPSPAVGSAKRPA